MSKKKTNRINDRLDRKYTHTEFLKEFFPNVNPNELRDDTRMLTEDEFFDVLQKVTEPAPSNQEK